MMSDTIIFMTFLTHAPKKRVDYLKMDTSIEKEFMKAIKAIEGTNSVYQETNP